MTQHDQRINPQQAISVSNAQFIQAIFKTQHNICHVTVFHNDPYLIPQEQRGAAWGGGHWGNQQGFFTQGGNQYFTISLFYPDDDGAARRRKSLFKQCNVIVVDDVGHGLSAKVDPNDPRLPPPSYKLETSPGNEQWGYILVLPEMSRHRVENLLDGMVAGNLCSDGSDPGMKGVTRYVRLPEGSNNKQKYIDVLGGPFQCQMNHWQPSTSYLIEDLAKAFNVDLDAERQSREGMLIDDSDHPGLQAYSASFGVKSKIAEGRYDVTCPNLHLHTNMDDSGTAIWTYPDGRLGFKCHHGHCEDSMSGNTIMGLLFQKDPALTERVALYGSPLTVLSGQPEQPIIDHQPEQPQVAPNLDGLCMDLSHDSDLNTVIIPLLRTIAQLPLESERDPLLQTIAHQTGRRISCLRSDLRNIIRQSNRSIVASGQEPAWVHMSENDMPLTTLENFKALLTFYGIRDRYNEMTKSLEIQIPGESFHTDTAKNAQILRMESLMIQHGMNPRQTVGWCNYAAQYDTYHPFREYLDSAGQWDGTDRITMLASTLKVAPEKQYLRDILLKRWLVSVCAAAMRDTTLNSEDSAESAPSPRGVFTLQGRQYMGKTRWFRRIAPKTMFKEGLQLSSDKDTVKQATNCLIVEIGEADVSTKQDAGKVKAFLSRDYDELRVPWDRAESRWPRRTVFGGSVNPEDFLKDTTGNGRWWVVPVEDIDFSLLSFINIKQLWLQAENLWLAGEPYLLTEPEMAMLNESNTESTHVSQFEETLLDLWHFDTMEGQKDPANWMNLAALSTKMKAYGIPVPRSTRESKEILFRLTRHTYDRRRRWKLPALRAFPDGE